MPTDTVMPPDAQGQHSAPTRNPWLKRYYFLRFAVSAAWVALAFTLGRHVPSLAALMLVAYPAWDAIANLADARRSGGAGRNATQMANVVASALTAIAIAAAIGRSMHEAIGIFGVWALFAGLLQLATGARRWKSHGAQWAMILSGAQSGIAGVHFVGLARGAVPLGIVTAAPYAAFGAFYFLVSALWLAVGDYVRNPSRMASGVRRA